MATNRLHQTSTQAAKSASARSSVKWIVRGRTLQVQNRVLNVVRDCQVVFYPEWLDATLTDDIEESVEFWFRYPVPGALLCVPEEGLSPARLKPVEAVSKLTHSQWLIRYTGRRARSIRRLYQQI
jgi:hypothetical protein